MVWRRSFACHVGYALRMRAIVAASRCCARPGCPMCVGPPAVLKRARTPQAARLRAIPIARSAAACGEQPTCLTHDLTIFGIWIACRRVRRALIRGRRDRYCAESTVLFVYNVLAETESRIARPREMPGAGGYPGAGRDAHGPARCVGTRAARTTVAARRGGPTANMK